MLWLLYCNAFTRQWFQGPHVSAFTPGSFRNRRSCLPWRSPSRAFPGNVHGRREPDDRERGRQVQAPGQRYRGLKQRRQRSWPSHGMSAGLSSGQPCRTATSVISGRFDQASIKRTGDRFATERVPVRARQTPNVATYLHQPCSDLSLKLPEQRYPHSSSAGSMPVQGPK